MNLPSGFTATSSSARPLQLLERAQFSAWRDGLRRPAAWVVPSLSTPPRHLLLCRGAGSGGRVDRSRPLDPYSFHVPYGLPPATGCGSVAARDRSRLHLGWGWHYPSTVTESSSEPALRVFRVPIRNIRPAAAFVRVLDLVTRHRAHVSTDLRRSPRLPPPRSQVSDTVEALLAQNFPAIHACRASHRAPL